MTKIFSSLLVVLVVAIALPVVCNAQIVVTDVDEVLGADSIRREFDSRPYFGLYKDNYFTAGTSVGPAPTRENSDVKFQVSIAQRLTRSTLPFNTYAFLFYSQKTLWNVFENSMPMHDLNFNPGIGLSKLLISKNRVIGKATLLVEHESNGRDSLQSRSWNKVSLSAALFLDPHFMVHGKVWIPIVDGENNKDILKYSGIFQTGIQAVSTNKRWVFDLTYVKRQGWNLNGNVTINLGFRLFKKHNQFLMLHYYNGYGECMLDYNQYHNRLRVGLLIRPELFSDF
ncbi:phospholipase A [Sodaliphilus sp.]|uniref:phospholipase A n=1 Tax=Sodaliphilus sp. TaxID=2815818 RepID=UPI0038903E04